jgi:hypothetical protein
MSKGTNLTNEIRTEISKNTNGRVVTWRSNAGSFWGEKVVSNNGHYLLLEHPTKIEGLPAGFADILCIISTVVTHEIVGQIIGVARFIEAKAEGDTVKPNQDKFMVMMRKKGAKAGIARLVEDALQIIGGSHVID